MVSIVPAGPEHGPGAYAVADAVRFHPDSARSAEGYLVSIAEAAEYSRRFAASAYSVVAVEEGRVVGFLRAVAGEEPELSPESASSPATYPSPVICSSTKSASSPPTRVKVWLKPCWTRSSFEASPSVWEPSSCTPRCATPVLSAFSLAATVFHWSTSSTTPTSLGDTTKNASTWYPDRSAPRRKRPICASSPGVIIPPRKSHAEVENA